MHPHRGRPARAIVAVLTLQLAGCVARPTWHGDEGTAYDILNQSTLTLVSIDRSTLDGPFRSALHEACAVLVFAGSDTGVPMSPAARGDGVLLVRDRMSGRWNGPAFYALRNHASDTAPHAGRHGRLIAVGCDAWRRLYTDAAAKAGDGSATVMEPDAVALSDMQAWSLSANRADPVPIGAIALRSLPAIAFAYYQAPAPLNAVMVDRSVRNDASAEILFAIEKLAD